MKRITALFLGMSLSALGCGDTDTGPGQPDDPDPVPGSGSCGLVVDANLETLNGVGDGAAGVPVYFAGPDGAYLGKATTDVKGEATFEGCVEDTMVTFFFADSGGGGGIAARNLGPGTSYSELYVYTHVQPGDTVFFDNDQYSAPFPQTHANVTVTGDADLSFTGFDNSGDWYARLGCESTDGFWDSTDGPEEPLHLENIGRSCLGADRGTVDVLGVVYDDGSEAFAFEKNVPVVEGTQAMPTDHEVILPPWTQGSIENAVLISGIPQDTTYVEYDADQFVDGQRWSGDDDSWGGNPGEFVPPTLVDHFEGLPEGFGDVSDTSAYWESSNGGVTARGTPFWSYQWTLQTRQDFNPTVELDVADALPRIDNLVPVDVHSARPAVRWFTESPISGTMATIHLELNLPAPEACCGDTNTLSILVVTPDIASGEVRVPELPEEVLAHFVGQVIDPTPKTMSIIHSDWADYQDIITNNRFFPWTVLHPSNSNAARVLPDTDGNGRLRRVSINRGSSEI